MSFTLSIRTTKNVSTIKILSNIYLARYKTTYDGDGKTKAKIMNEDADLGLMINGYSQIGFRLNNNMTVIGPMAIFPRSVLSWNVKSFNDINEDSLKLFSILDPQLDILILGTGDYTNNTDFFLNAIKFMRKYKIGLEILPTEQAVSTFNFLNSEGRCVAGGFIPPSHVKTSEDDVIKNKLKYQNIYEIDD